MKLARMFKKVVALVLIMVISTTAVFNSKVVVAAHNIYDLANWEYILQEFEERYGGANNPVVTFVEGISLLTYDGDMQIRNNLQYNYVDGRLVSILDSRGNTAYLVYDDDGNLVQVLANGDVINIEVNEFGLISSFNIEGTNIGASYIYDEYGIFSGIIHNDTEISITFERDSNVQYIYHNNTRISENRKPNNGAHNIYCHSDSTATIDTVKIDVSAEGYIEAMHYGMAGYFMSAAFDFDYTNEIMNINFSNDVVFSAQYDEFGFASTSVSVISDDGSVNEMLTRVVPTITPSGNLYRLDEINFNQHNRHSRYSMNEMGFIGHVYHQGFLALEFVYDRQTGQLLKAIDYVNNITYSHVFDDFGNILSRTIEKPSGTEVFVYEYGNPEWRDQLTAFNGSPIHYDMSGNMVRGLGMRLFWENNQLRQLYVDGNSLSFTYNAEGFRNSRTLNGETTTFQLSANGIVLAEHSSNGQNIVYLFDHDENRIGFELNGVTYLYLTNLMGDIVGIVDSDFNVIVEYVYCPWGSIVEVKGPKADTIGRINPYRFRGYRFDDISGMYYIAGRHYSPLIARFINPDNSLGIIGSSLSHNLYAYALNNPIMNSYDIDTFGLMVLIKTISLWKFVKTVVVTFTVLLSFYLAWQIGANWNHFTSLMWDLYWVIRDMTVTQKWVSQLAQQMDTANRLYNWRTKVHAHHIVALHDWRAANSRNILWNNGFNLNGPPNIAAVRASLHARLHTDMYHSAVFWVVFTANGFIFDANNPWRIWDALVVLRNSLESASALVP
ncbi:MAG: AHH domain-containing protein [Firmicutes bacterium]|nr:AHH domain-containing protein [Bacillota bacterium]